MPYAECVYTFRAAVGDNPATRTHLGSESFVSLDINSAVPAGLIAELNTERGPASIRDGLSHLGLLEPGRVHIADNDDLILTRKFCAFNVEMVPSGVGDLCAYGCCAAFVLGALGFAESFFIFSVVPHSGNNGTITHGRQILQPKIYADNPASGRRDVGNLALKSDVPSSSGVLDKRACSDVVRNFSGAPETKFLSVPLHNVAMDALTTAAAKRYPTQGTARAFARSKLRRAPVRVSRGRKYPANFADRFAADTQFSTCSCGQFGQVKMRRPARLSPSPPVTLRLPLDLTAVIPNKVHRAGMGFKPLPAVGILYPEFVGEDHFKNLAEAA